MTVKPGSWTVFFFWKRVCFGGSNHTAMVYREKYSLYIPEKKQGIYFEGRLSFLGFKYESEVTAFLEQQGEAKERETELASPFVTTF